KGCLQRFEQFLAKPATGGNRQIRVFGDVWHTVEIGDFTVQEIAHEKRVRQAHPPKGLEAPDGCRCAYHRRSHCGVLTIRLLQLLRKTPASRFKTRVRSSCSEIAT